MIPFNWLFESKSLCQEFVLDLWSSFSHTITKRIGLIILCPVQSSHSFSVVLLLPSPTLESFIYLSYPMKSMYIYSYGKWILLYFSFYIPIFFFMNLQIHIHINRCPWFVKGEVYIVVVVDIISFDNRDWYATISTLAPSHELISIHSSAGPKCMRTMRRKVKRWPMNHFPSYHHRLHHHHHPHRPPIPSPLRSRTMSYRRMY